MVYEYAVDPSLMATWGDIDRYRIFLEAFGLGTPRILSRYPKKWRKAVWHHVEQLDSTVTDLDRKRLDEILDTLGTPVIKRPPNPPDVHLGWQEWALSQHKECQFDVLLTDAKLETENALSGQDILSARNKLWDRPRQSQVFRRAEQMAEAVAPLLRHASAIVLVDPHFNPTEERFLRPLGQFLRAALRGRPSGTPERIELHTSNKLRMVPRFPSNDFPRSGTSRRATPVSASTFRFLCQKHVASQLPPETELTIHRWRRKPEGERLHDRFILTELGGLTFQKGLDEGDFAEREDITLQERAVYERHWANYAPDAHVFDVFQRPFIVRSSVRL